MFLKLHITLFVVLFFAQHFSNTNAKGVCSLEAMKLMAYDACEHIFKRDSRRARSNMIEGEFYPTSMVKIKRRSYPVGGYLKVPHHDAINLKSLHIEPRYEIHNSKSLHFSRDKRHNNAQKAIKYCCVMECGPELYCRP